ncbi:MAG: FUSC family protein [Acetobacteraceae bacterium]|nr:FUSC family protein [Acetobacteraceae bacterium]
MATRIPSDFRRLPITQNLQGLSVLEGLRAALSVAVIIALDNVFDWAPLREAALAAMLTCICDPGGPIRRRVPVLIGFALGGALLTGGLGFARGFGLPVALPVGVFALFCASFARIYGTVPQQLGGLLGVVIVLALDRPVPELGEAAVLTAAFAGGALWSTLLTLALWPLHPFLPARRAVAAVYRSLALLTADLRALLRSTATDAAAWEHHARAHRRAVREAIETARTQVVDTLRARGSAGARATQSLIRLETADQIFGAMIALGELLEQATPLEHRTADPLLRRLRPLLVVLGEVILTDDPKAHQRIARAIDRMAAEAAVLPPDDKLRPLADRIVERLRIAHTLAVPGNFLPGTASGGRRPSLRQRLLQPLQTNLTWRSPILRHALRAAVAAAPALAYTMLWFTPYDHWLTITIVATMQPFFALTYTRAVERVLGTALGGVVAALVGVLCTTKLAVAAAMFPLAVMAFTVRSVSLGMFMLALTPLVVLLVETGQPDTSEWLIAGARALLTTIGGVVAVAATFLLWPSREPARVIGQAREAVAAHGRYADAVVGALLGRGDAASVERARREAGIANNAFEATINRALLEPGSADPNRLEAALVIDAALRRCAGRLSVFQFDPALARSVPPEALLAWGDWISGGLAMVASGRSALPPRPQAAANDTILRLARQVELMAGIVERLGQPATA